MVCVRFVNTKFNLFIIQLLSAKIIFLEIVYLAVNLKVYVNENRIFGL